MTDQDRLNELLAELSSWTGKRTRLRNEVLETFGPDASIAEQIEVAERVLAEPCRGWAGGKAEEIRANRLRGQQDG